MPLGRGAVVAVGTRGRGLAPASLPAIADELARLGATHLLLEPAGAFSEGGAEPFSALGALVGAPASLGLGAWCALEGGRLPAILAKHAASLALLRSGPVDIVLEDRAARPGRLAEAAAVIRLLSGDGPVSFTGAHYRLDGAFNEPRPRPPFHLGLGVSTPGVSAELAARIDYALVPLPAPAEGLLAGTSQFEARRVDGSGAVVSRLLRCSTADPDALLVAFGAFVAG